MNSRISRLLCAILFIASPFFCTAQSDELIDAYENFQKYYGNGQIELAITWAKKALVLEEKEFGKNDLDHGYTLNNLATIYQNQKRFDEAIPLFIEAARIFKEKLGKDDPNYGVVLNNLAVLYENSNKWDSAAYHYQQVLAIRKAQLGSQHEKYHETLANLGNVLVRIGQADSAQIHLQELIDLLDNQSKNTTKLYADACYQIATCYASVDSVQLAEKYYLKGKHVEVNLPSGKTVKYAIGLSKIAMFYEELGKYDAAEPLYEESSSVLKQQLGDQDTLYATSLINLAILHEELGKYVQAQHNYDDALGIIEQHYGKDHLKYAEALNNKAGLLVELGKYALAEPLYQQALDVYQRELGRKSKKYLSVHNNLAILYSKMGKNEDAEKIYRIVIEVYRSIEQTKSEDYALVVNNLASLLKDRENYQEAEKLYHEALLIKQNRLGRAHPEYAISLNNLASLYKNMGKLKEAEPLFREAIEIKKNSLGESHPEYAFSLNNLGSLYEEMKDYTQAEPLYLEALTTIKRHLGEKHPSYATTLNNLAVLYDGMGQLTKAESYYIQANQNLLYQIQYYFPYLNENSRKRFWDQNLSTGFVAFYNFAKKRAVSNPQIIGHAYDYRLATKALLLDGTAKMRNAILNSNDTELINKYNSWLTLKNSIAQAFTLSKEELEAYGWDIQDLEQEASRLESELSRQSSHFNEATQQQQITWRDVQRHLKEDEAAIEIIRVQSPNKQNPIQYLCMIVKANSTANPELVMIEDGQKLESKLIKYYHNCIAFQIEDAYSYQNFWLPISKHLEGVNKVYVSSDGVYNQINLATMANPQTGNFLVDEKTIHLVTNTREIIGWQETKRSNEKVAYLLGHPSYKVESDDDVMASAKTPKSSRGTRLGKWFDKTSFDELPGTEEEIIQIAEQLQQANWELTIKLHEQAMEEELKQVSNPTILHIATHGFFIASEDKSQTAKGHSSENPMLRSGVVLAGVENYYSATEKPNTEDGILTAYEATTLFLDQTDLVVLSACETGLGEVRDGEGVYGLQRAFKVAGANTILMSLWKVNDEATQKLMTYFYRNWLVTQDKREAFKQAQFQLRNEFPDPYYWGAFIMVGE